MGVQTKHFLPILNFNSKMFLIVTTLTSSEFEKPIFGSNLTNPQGNTNCTQTPLHYIRPLHIALLHRFLSTPHDLKITAIKFLNIFKANLSIHESEWFFTRQNFSALPFSSSCGSVGRLDLYIRHFSIQHFNIRHPNIQYFNIRHLNI